MWNVFYEDARKAIEEVFFEECVYADDLNAFRTFPESTPNNVVTECLKACQQELHTWGQANQVAFDASKEGFYIISTSEPQGEKFKILGVVFDTSLSMQAAVDDLVSAASWKLKMLLRIKRYYSDEDMVVFYKAN